MEDSRRAIDCARLSESSGILSDFWLLRTSTAQGGLRCHNAIDPAPAGSVNRRCEACKAALALLVLQKHVPPIFSISAVFTSHGTSKNSVASGGSYVTTAST